MTPDRRTLMRRASESLVARWRTLRSLPVLNPAGLREMRSERFGYPIDAHMPHLLSALNWLAAAQDGTPDDGFARGYSMMYNVYFGSRGWQPSYPETTGYIIPTLLEAARYSDRGDLVERALRAARWESAIQMESGAVQGGVIGQARAPAVFNTGQVILGWLAAFELTGDGMFEASARKAGNYLVSVMETDGHWRSGNSTFARADTTLYNARVAWALAEAGVRLRVPGFRDAAARNLRAVMSEQHANGWFPHCCLDDPNQPLLHTLAYATRGLLEGGRVLEDDSMLRAASRTATALQASVRADGWMPGRFNADWSGGAEWSCLTGEAQTANNWMRLFLITGEDAWLEHVPRVLTFLKTTQNRSSSETGIRGGIKGSYPMSGGYGQYEVLNWATKYFADALMRHQQILDGTAQSRALAFSLA